MLSVLASAGGEASKASCPASQQASKQSHGCVQGQQAHLQTDSSSSVRGHCGLGERQFAKSAATVSGGPAVYVRSEHARLRCAELRLRNPHGHQHKQPAQVVETWEATP